MQLLALDANRFGPDEQLVIDVAQCESQVFFPDDPRQVPQLSGCPREAETMRHTRRILICKGEPKMTNLVVHLCAKCAAVWDEQDAPTKFRTEYFQSEGCDER